MPTSQQTHYSEHIACRCLYHSSEDVSSQIPWHNPFTEDPIHERQHFRHNSEPISPTTPLSPSLTALRPHGETPHRKTATPIVSPLWAPSSFSLSVINPNLDLDLLSQNAQRHTSPSSLADFAGRSHTSPNSSNSRKKETEIAWPSQMEDIHYTYH
jgi:hypothetical protein